MCNFKEKYKSLKKKGKHGAMYVSTVVKIISCVVVGALVISGLAVVTNGAMNSASGKVDSLFAKSYNYEGNSNNGGAIVPGEGENEAGKTAVYIDGAKQLVENGGSVTLPVNNSSNFVGYLSSSKKLYRAGQSVSLSEDTIFSTIEMGIEMDSVGYKIREKGTTYGIRFYTKLDTDLVASLREAGATVELGTLIGPANAIGSDDLTFALDESKYIDVVYSSAEWYEEDSFKGMVGSIANIKEKNANRDFIGRGYAKIHYEDSNGNTIDKICYASYAGGDIANNTANIAELSHQLKADTAAYNELDDTVKAQVDTYASLYQG